MISDTGTQQIKNNFKDYLDRIFLKHLNVVASLTIFILGYYAYSDWFVRHCLAAALTRLVPIVLIFLLLLINLICPINYLRFKKYLYLVIYMALQGMMYAISLIHLHDAALAPSVTGAILVLFLVSLDSKENNSITMVIYGLPILVFTFLLLWIGKPSAKEFYVLADIYPIIFIGFAINRIHYRLRFRLFKSNHLLKIEQEKTKLLYKQTLDINEKLENKAVEAILIKEEIQEKNLALNKSNATKDRFLGIIAHDLRNPMGAIWGLSDLLLLDEEIEEKDKKKCIESINISVKHTYGLLENLLSWAMAQDKDIHFNPSWYNAYEVVEKEIDILSQIAGNKCIKIINNIAPTHKVFADLKMLETIVRNIISNSIKYSLPKGKIEINANSHSDDEKEYTEIIIIDYGVGITEDQLSNLFKETKNISTKGTDNESGTGLGLLLCKEFIDIHNGSINVSSKLNEGSTFKCVFPAAV